MSARIPLPESVIGSGVVAVLRADRAEEYLPVCAVLVEEGITALELTLTTPGTIAALPDILSALPDAFVGVGTILTDRDLWDAVGAGARFLVTPIAAPMLVDAAVSAKVPIIPGALSPTDVQAVWAAGASAVKIFPASTVGPDYVRQLAGPFPDIRTVPSGGVDLDSIPAWIRAGASAVSLGGPLLGDALRGGDLSGLRERARRAAAQVRVARASLS